MGILNGKDRYFSFKVFIDMIILIKNNSLISNNFKINIQFDKVNLEGFDMHESPLV